MTCLYTYSVYATHKLKNLNICMWKINIIVNENSILIWLNALYSDGRMILVKNNDSVQHIICPFGKS